MKNWQKNQQECLMYSKSIQQLRHSSAKETERRIRCQHIPFAI